MPRAPRIYVANCLYYVTAKGNLGEKIFIDEKDYLMYMELLKKYKEQYGFKLFSFSMMPDSLSLLIELKEGEKLSLVMHDISSSYTKYYNSRYDRKGHVFRERFKSLVVEKEQYLLHMVRYLHFAPVKAGLVKGPHEYSFSSDLQYLIASGQEGDFSGQRLGQREILSISQEISEVFTALAQISPERASYAEFIAEASAQELDSLAKKIASRSILGSDEFAASIDAQIRRKEIQARKAKGIRPAVYLVVTFAVAGVVATVAYYNYMDSLNRKIAADEAMARDPGVGRRQEAPLTAPLTDLDGTEWVVELVPDKDVHRIYPQLDKLVFNKGAVHLTYFLGQGFVSSNYSLTTQEDGALVWETMQSNADGETLFWHGEEREGAMKGRFSVTSKDGKKEGVSFASPGYYKIIKEQK